MIYYIIDQFPQFFGKMLLEVVMNSNRPTTYCIEKPTKRQTHSKSAPDQIPTTNKEDSYTDNSLTLQPSPNCGKNPLGACSKKVTQITNSPQQGAPKEKTDKPVFPSAPHLRSLFPQPSCGNTSASAPAQILRSKRFLLHIRYLHGKSRSSFFNRV